MSKIISKAALTMLFAAMLIAASMPLLKADTLCPPPQYDITGVWEWNYHYNEATYAHTMIIDSFDSSTGAFSGDGFYNPNPEYTFNVVGWESGINVAMHIDYTGTAPPYQIDATGVLGSDTFMSGTATPPGVACVPEWDATKIGNIPPGENVTVNPHPDVGLTFDLVTTPGFATVDALESPPEGIPPLTGIIGPYFDIEVTALFDGNVLVAITYHDIPMVSCKESGLRLFTTDGGTLSGDVNEDGVVNVKDLVLVAKAMGTVPGDRRWNPACDLNGDGAINVKDLKIVICHLGDSIWEDITVNIDTVNNIIYGVTDHFSLFGVR